MKKYVFYFLALAALMTSCISDFSLWGIPWDHEYQKVTYPDIAVDMTYIPPGNLGQIELPHKYSQKYQSELIGEIKY